MLLKAEGCLVFLFVLSICVSCQTENWNTTAPVPTSETCDYPSTSVCALDFSSVKGEYNNTWNGTVQFYDYTPPGGTLKTLQIEIFGSFESVENSTNITLLINGITWLPWEFLPGFQNDCTLSVDSGSVTGVAPILQQGSLNTLAIVVPSGGPMIAACGFNILGTYLPPPTPSATATATGSPSAEPSPTAAPTDTATTITPTNTATPATETITPTASTSITPTSSVSVAPTSTWTLTPTFTPMNSTWQTTAPVATQETCFYNNTGKCVSEFFSANGQYGVSWSGSVYFSDLTPPGAMLVNLEVTLYGAFDSGTVTASINGGVWAQALYSGDYLCEQITDSVTLSGPPVVPSLAGDTNLLRFVPTSRQNFTACGAVVVGTYNYVSTTATFSNSPSTSHSNTPTNTPSNSPTPSSMPSGNTNTWNTTGPVATIDICQWDSSSICATTFFLAYGKYNETWTGEIFFSDLTPPGSQLLSLTVNLYGSFMNTGEPSTIQTLINNIPWQVWNYDPQNYMYQCQSATDLVTLTSPPVGPSLPGDSNLFSIKVPNGGSNGGPEIYACGATFIGTYTTPPDSSWQTTAPVATIDTCSWPNSTVCESTFFSAHGEYGYSWSGSVYFSDLTPIGATLDYLEVTLFGSFENVTSASSISVEINGMPWTTWEYPPNQYSNDCTSQEDSVTLTGPPTAPSLLGDSNLLTFNVPLGGPQIYACGAIIVGNYTFAVTTSTFSSTPTPSVFGTPSMSPSISPPSGSVPTTWNTTAPVATQETCEWNGHSACATEFFFANGQYNVSWDGKIYFSDNAAPGTTTSLLSVTLYGSFGNFSEGATIPVSINGVAWTTWNYDSSLFISNCVDGTDEVTLTASVNGIPLTSSGNYLDFTIPAAGLEISACGAYINGTTSALMVTPTLTPTLGNTITPSVTPTGTATGTVTTNSTGVTPELSSNSDFSWWAVALIVIGVVVIISILVLGAGMAFFHWKSKQLNQYAIMN